MPVALCRTAIPLPAHAKHGIYTKDFHRPYHAADAFYRSGKVLLLLRREDTKECLKINTNKARGVINIDCRREASA
ncbi:hypothetical protein NBRC3293_2827 [Gluconobacter oxydans NBRC 3293]|uniref:Uncharacterized protein n=1 Tax=Gluconobacter oxydans NBRC 3293 TaxID=1315969 RepID=A0A829WZZ2_GLUOY|nr:hypothetical protein NBRC3293_2827 [Gluconobacter oxydans NBRC 3293]